MCGTCSVAGEEVALWQKTYFTHSKNEKLGWLTYTEKGLESKFGIKQLRIVIDFEQQNTMNNPETDTSSKSWQMNWEETRG